MDDESCHAHVALHSLIVRVIAAMSREIECDAAKLHVSACLRTCETHALKEAGAHAPEPLPACLDGTFVKGVALLSCAEPRILPNSPRLLRIHCRVWSSRVGESTCVLALS